MNRRRFLQIAGIGGLAVMAPIAVRERETRASAKYKGPFFIMVNAGGGWDQTMLMDPKGGTDAMDPMQINHSYTPNDIGHAGGIAYAPTTWANNGVTLMSAASFFNAHHGRLRVFNGVDTGTISHDGGSRVTWSGLNTEGVPSFAAVAAAAATAAQPVPLAYLSNGGYDSTAGLISLSRVGGTGSLLRLAFTNDMTPGDDKTGHYHSPTTAGRIAAAQEARLRAQRDKQRLPTVAGSMNTLYLARQSDDGLSGLGEMLKSFKLAQFPEDFPEVDGIGNIGEMESLIQQAQIALLSFKSGVAVSANLDMGGYDSHDNSDGRQSRQFMILCFALDYLFKQIDLLGLKDQVYVVVGSDFGRTPTYNTNNNGKDHWNITSVMVAGPGIGGDKVIGASDAGLKPLAVDPKTLKLSTASTAVTIQPVHIHHALRRAAGIEKSEAAMAYPLPGDYLPLFG